MAGLQGETVMVAGAARRKCVAPDQQLTLWPNIP